VVRLQLGRLSAMAGATEQREMQTAAVLEASGARPPAGARSSTRGGRLAREHREWKELGATGEGVGWMRSEGKGEGWRCQRR
jgi:hypothetical protein